MPGTVLAILKRVSKILPVVLLHYRKGKTMRVLNSRFWISTGLGLVLVAVVALVGCFEDFAPMAPSTDTASVQEPHWLTYERPHHLGAAKVVTTSWTIDLRSGGRLVLEDGSLVATFNIPPQSVGGGSITISMSVDGSGRVIIDFGPDGTFFSPEATLTVSGAQLDGDDVGDEDVVLYWWDSVTQMWVQLSTQVEVDDGQAITTVSHFSLYGLGGGILK
jgi:hypothetical protein